MIVATPATYRNSVGVLLSDALSFGLALLEGVLVLELGTHLGMRVVDEREFGSRVGVGEERSDL